MRPEEQESEMRPEPVDDLPTLTVVSNLDGDRDASEAAAAGGLEPAAGLSHTEIPVAPNALPAALLPGEAFDLGIEALEVLGELPYRDPRRATSVTWWESDPETLSEPDTFTEYALDSEDTSVSSTRASTSATNTASGSLTRLSQRSSVRGFSVVVRGARSPHGRFRGAASHGYRGRSVTRRERGASRTAALRHRHPTHTPSRGPNPRRAPEPLMMMLMANHRHLIAPPHRIHQIGRVREEAAEGGL